MDLNSPVTMESISHRIVRPSVPLKMKNLYRGEPMALGITQMFIGIMQIAFGLVIAVVKSDDKDFFHGEHIVTPYWIGIMYIISGSLSSAAAKISNKPLLKGMLGMNIVSAVAAGIGIVILSISLAFRHDQHWCYGFGHDILPEICREYIAIPYVQMYNMSAVLLVFNILEFLIAIITAAFGCATLCRNNFSETTVVIFQNTDQGTSSAVLTPDKGDEVS